MLALQGLREQISILDWYLWLVAPLLHLLPPGQLRPSSVMQLLQQLLLQLQLSSRQRKLKSNHVVREVIWCVKLSYLWMQLLSWMTS